MENFSEEAFAAYVAAFLDGEGSIMTQETKGKLYIRCALTNTHKGVLLAIQKRMNYGIIYEAKRSEWGRKPGFHLYINSFKQNEDFLRMIRPYLIIKADKADKALAIIESRKAAIDVYKERNRLIMLEIEAGVPQVEIARKFNMSQGNISCIKLGKTWPSKAKKYRRTLERQSHGLSPDSRPSRPDHSTILG